MNHPAFRLKITEKPSKTSPGETCLDHSLKIYNVNKSLPPAPVKVVKGILSKVMFYYTCKHQFEVMENLLLQMRIFFWVLKIFISIFVLDIFTLSILEISLFYKKSEKCKKQFV